jgi:thiosulfate/3-mercaptopyruvate sulfurtransferase
MFKAVKYCAAAVVPVWLLLAQPSFAAEGVNGNLVDVQWLASNLHNADVVVLDASMGGQLYEAKHIPGAIKVDFLTYGFPERPTADMEQRYQSWGISPGKKIVMYDQGGTYMATRLFFSLYYHGFPVQDLFVLNGGLTKWEAEGQRVTKDVPPSPAKGTFRITKINEDVRVRLPEFLAASGDLAHNVLLEALDTGWHYGQTAPFGKAGHIPHSTLLPAEDFFNADKTFKSADEIRKMLTYAGVKPEQRVHSYCGGGVAASVPFFATKFIANYPKVTLFVESQMGWMSDDRDLPLWTYDAPFMMRDVGWVQSWGGPMMRMVGASQVSIIDVRPAAAFNEGHIPFALNVPADAFRSNMATPEKLAQLLGSAGVNPSHEAVVVSGAALTKDSALAYAMLEKLGQRKISVLSDSADKWEERGVKVTKTPTSLPAVTYSPALRNGVLSADSTTTEVDYPKVFIASGANVPAKAPDGKVIHVPYTDLLNADGTPRPAKDIWAALTKAGVPRYAEIVCFSDDPGEAAANYFMFKLMGFPDVKMLI